MVWLGGAKSELDAHNHVQQENCGMDMLCITRSFKRHWEADEKMEAKGAAVTFFFCARKNNNFGRFISSVTVQGVNRSVIIIPEITFNAGWRDVAFKIDKFIKENTGPFITNILGKSDPKIHTQPLSELGNGKLGFQIKSWSTQATTKLS